MPQEPLVDPIAACQPPPFSCLLSCYRGPGRRLHVHIYACSDHLTAQTCVFQKQRRCHRRQHPRSTQFFVFRPSPFKQIKHRNKMPFTSQRKGCTARIKKERNSKGRQQQQASPPTAAAAHVCMVWSQSPLHYLLLIKSSPIQFAIYSSNSWVTANTTPCADTPPLPAFARSVAL